MATVTTNSTATMPITAVSMAPVAAGALSNRGAAGSLSSPSEPNQGSWWLFQLGGSLRSSKKILVWGPGSCPLKTVGRSAWHCSGLCHCFLSLSRLLRAAVNSTGRLFSLVLISFSVSEIGDPPWIHL